ncbi:hypothetical protein V7S43_011180 [Phytophthora oleae]|uniref:RxLR effector protein n=1 Tax=Phytophthora oleae TaxID=2107226 RepID=A0ABD3FBU7_9STRA
MGDSKLTVAEVAAPHSRFLRKSEPKTSEERAFDSLTSKIDDLVDASKLKKYKLQWNQLQLGDDLAAVLKSPQVEKLAKFNLNRAPGSQVSLIGRLTAKYGDDIVARTLVSLERNAGDNPTRLSMVKQLRDDQVANWLKNGETVPGVLGILKLGKDESIFRSKALDVLEDFIKKYNTAKHGDESLLKTLTTVYGGESELVTMITRARTSYPYAQMNPQSVEKAKSIENQLISKWRSDKLPEFSVMSKLKFSDDINAALSTGKVRVLFKYSASKTSVLKRLNAKYGEGEVAVALARAKNTPSGHDVATVLQQKQLTGWLNNGDSVDKVFSILKFKDAGVFSYKLDVLDEYVKLVKTTNPEDTTNIFKLLRKVFSGDEDKLAIALSRPLDGEAKGYQALLFKEWLAKDLDPMSVAVNVFKMPEADVAAAKYSSEVKPIIKQYTKFFNGAADIQPLPPAVRNGRS